MTCRHSKGDPDCSSTVGGWAWQEQQDYYEKSREQSAQKKIDEAEKKVKELLDRTPNPEIFEVVRFLQVGHHLVLEVQYSSCPSCTFDAKKIMVFEHTQATDVIFWKTIDPHFSPSPKNRSKNVSPPPRARFPADERGWKDACIFAQGMK